jgi:biopolymer transport protein ExbB/TolQ
MFREEFLLGGPVMYALFAVWVLMLALILDRVLFWLARPVRRRDTDTAGEFGRNHERIDALSQIATSLGLFGTVIGIARSFFARGADLSLAAPEVLASGLATALFTTVAGLAIFLFGQGSLFAFEWLADRETRRLEART